MEMMILRHYYFFTLNIVQLHFIIQTKLYIQIIILQFTLIDKHENIIL